MRTSEVAAVPGKRPSKRSREVNAALRDAEGIVELTNMQLRLAIELRRKLEGLAGKGARAQKRRAPRKRE